jgi:SAM-dependent methyltransferase
MLKLHLGNGSVYLDGWVNIDMFCPRASDYPELVEHNKTTIDHYFKFPIGENKGNSVTDIVMDVRKLEFEDNSVDEILCVDLLDHIKREDIARTIMEWQRVLKPGGTLTIDVDDRVEQAKRLIKAKTIKDFERALKLIYCESSEGMKHWWGFTSWYLKDILDAANFKFVWEKKDFIVHVDPHFQICVQK